MLAFADYISQRAISQWLLFLLVILWINFNIFHFPHKLFIYCSYECNMAKKHLHDWSLLKSTRAFLLLFIPFFSGEKIHLCSTCFLMDSCFSGVQHQRKSKGWCRVECLTIWLGVGQAPASSQRVIVKFEWGLSALRPAGTQRLWVSRDWDDSFISVVYIVVTVFLLELKRPGILGPWITVWRKSPRNQDYSCRIII